MGLTKLQIMELFIVEGTEHVQLLEQSLEQLEKRESLEQLYSDMHIHAHTIKGAAAMVGFMNTSHVARFLEKILLCLKDKSLPLNDEIISFIKESTTIIQKFLRNITLGELNETIILKDIASKYDKIISKVVPVNA